MGYKPFIHWLNRLEEAVDRIVEMHYDFKAGEIVADVLPDEEPGLESFDKQTYRYRLQNHGHEETREIEAEGDAQALRRVIVQIYHPTIEVPSDVKQARDLLMTLRINDVQPLLLWVRNITTKKFLYDTEGRHYITQSDNKPEL